MGKITIQIFQYHRLFAVENVDAISFKAEGKGVLTILPDHMPVITAIKNSAITLKFGSEQQKTKSFWVQNAIFYFQLNQANLVADEVKEKI